MYLIDIAKCVNEEKDENPISIIEDECNFILDDIYRIIEVSDFKKENIPEITMEFLKNCENKDIEKIRKDFWRWILLVLGENKDWTIRTVRYSRNKDWVLFWTILDFL